MYDYGIADGPPGNLIFESNGGRAEPCKQQGQTERPKPGLTRHDRPHGERHGNHMLMSLGRHRAGCMYPGLRTANGPEEEWHDELADSRIAYESTSYTSKALPSFGYSCKLGGII